MDSKQYQLENLLEFADQYRQEIDLVLALPQGAMVAEKIARALGKPWQMLEEEDNSPEKQTWRGKGVLLVDQAADSGAAILEGISVLRSRGAHPVGAAVPVTSVKALSVIEDRADFFLAQRTVQDISDLARSHPPIP